jgi:hypothetical protein
MEQNHSNYTPSPQPRSGFFPMMNPPRTQPANDTATAGLLLRRYGCRGFADTAGAPGFP